MNERRAVFNATIISAVLCGVFFAAGKAGAVDSGLHWFIGFLAVGCYAFVALLVWPRRAGPGPFGLALAGGLAWAGLLVALLIAALPVLVDPAGVDPRILGGAFLFGGTQVWMARSAASTAAANGQRSLVRRVAVALTATVLGFVWVVLLAPVVFRNVSHRDESSTMGDLRAFVSAQVVFESLNGGLFGTPECLVAPGACIADLPEGGPNFLDATFLQAVRGGYRYSFHPGPPGAVEGRQGVEAWAYVAIPEPPGGDEVLSFCVDATGVLRRWPDHKMPVPVAGVCPPEATAMH